MLPNSISVSNAILNSVCGNPLLVGTKCLLPLSKGIAIKAQTNIEFSIQILFGFTFLIQIFF